MVPRNFRWHLVLASLVLVLLSFCAIQSHAAVLPSESGGSGGPVPQKILDPPQDGGKGGPRDGGDPDEVVIFIASPGTPGVVTDLPKAGTTQPGSVNVSETLVQFRFLLFWMGVAR